LRPKRAPFSGGNVNSVEAAVKGVGNAFDLYWSSCREEIGEELPFDPLTEAWQTALRSILRVLTQLDESLSRGDMKTVQTALDLAKRAFEVTAALDQSSGQKSGIRQRFPGRIAK
jgi:hypothetical protein